MDALTQYVELGFQIIGVAALIATITPTPVDDGILMTLKRILDIVALNIGHAKNLK